MNDIKIADVQSLADTGQIVWTEHLSLRMRERNIKRADVLTCIHNGEIIEQYPEDYPFPSCLIFAVLADDKPIHVVAGIGNNQLCIITVYYPTLEKWENDYKTRKVGK